MTTKVITAVVLATFLIGCDAPSAKPAWKERLKANCRAAAEIWDREVKFQGSWCWVQVGEDWIRGDDFVEIMRVRNLNENQGAGQ